MSTHHACLEFYSAARPLRRVATLAMALCLSSGCLTTLDLSEDFSPDGSTTEDMRPRPDAPVDMRPDQMTPPPEDMRPDGAPEDMPDEEDMPEMPAPADMPVDSPPDMPPATPGEGLIISELIEGSMGFNKVVEIYNTSTRPSPLEGVFLVLLSHNMETLEDASKMPLDKQIQSLGSGELLTLCHSSVDKLPTSECDLLDAFVLNFNGDDRVAIIHDVDGDGLITDTDFDMGGVLDGFGRLDDNAPDPGTWADKTFRRCDFTPYRSLGPFVLAALYETVPENFGQIGDPPTEGCP